MTQSCARCGASGAHVFRRHYVVPHGEGEALRLEVEELVLCRPCFLELGKKVGVERRALFEELRRRTLHA